MVTVENSFKLYGSLAAMKDFKLTVNRGDVMKLVGPDGEGKTTTLRGTIGILPRAAMPIVLRP